MRSHQSVQLVWVKDPSVYLGRLAVGGLILLTALVGAWLAAGGASARWTAAVQSRASGPITQIGTAGPARLSAAGPLTNTIIYSVHGAAGAFYGSVRAVGLNGALDRDVIFVGGYPRMSPDGNYVVYMRDGEANGYRGKLWLRDLQTGADTMIFDNPDWIASYSWTADSQHIILDYYCNIYEIDRSGSNLHQLWNAPNCWEDAPAVNLLDGRIAFHNVQGGGGIGLVEANYSNRRIITNTMAGDMWPAWSPDGQWISFLRTGNDNTLPANYFKIHPDGSGLTQLTFAAKASDSFGPIGAWTADGSRIIAPGRQGHTAGTFTNIYSFLADGSGAVALIFTQPGALIDRVGSVGLFPSPTTTQVVVQGPRIAAPGETVDFVIEYANYMTQTAESAVVVLALPDGADLMDSSGGGVPWSEVRQVFWPLGNLAPETSGVVSARVRFAWGLPLHSHYKTVAYLAAANLPNNPIDLAPYLTAGPTQVTGGTSLTDAQVQAERQTYPDVATLLGRAESAGYGRINAQRLTLSTGKMITDIMLLQPAAGATMHLIRSGEGVQATTIGRDFFAIQDPTGGMTMSLPDQSRQTWGSWASPATGFAPSQAAAPSANIDYPTCMKNCLTEKAPAALASHLSGLAALGLRGLDCYTCIQSAKNGWKDVDVDACMSCADKVPGYGDLREVVKCQEDCKSDSNTHVCTRNVPYCDEVLPGFGVWRIMENQCDTTTGQFQLSPAFISQCDLGAKCVQAPGGKPTCETCPQPKPQSSVTAWVLPPAPPALTSAPASVCATAEGGNTSCRDTEIRVAGDPNALYGPAGDLLPGQLVTYTVAYENVGAGQAYGVFVVTQLSEHLAPESLTIYGDGEFYSGTRTLIWSVGELAPQSQPGASGSVSFTVRLKDNLPSGTTIIHRAVVHFPSVPEETPTNPVVNIVQPLVAAPQQIETTYGQPVTITLAGRDVSGSPLSYAVSDTPWHGSLGGIAPALIYTPQASFIGLDHFTFKVSNAVTESRPAEVQVLVNPSPTDSTPPGVAWTVPGNGAMVGPVSISPGFTDTLGPLYQPVIVAQFSEPISATTVTTQTVTMTDNHGVPVAVSVSYDGTLDQALIAPRAPLPERSEYQVRIAATVTDLSGNRLPADYAFHFHIGPPFLVYLPAIAR